MFEISREQVTTMQDKQMTNADESRPQTLSSRELHLVSEIERLLQTISVISPKTIEQIIFAFSTNYREMAIQMAMEQFVAAMRSHVFQLAVTYYQQAEKEGISAQYRDKTWQDVEADTYGIMTLNQRLEVDTVENLFKLGTIAVNVMNLSYFNTAEETESSLYTIPGMYQSWLKQAHLIREK